MLYQAESIDSIRAFVEAKHGKLLSTEYKKFNIKLKYECEKGHQWEALWASVKTTKTWCPYCAGNIKNTPEKILSICQEAGLELVTPITTYKSDKTKMTYRCIKNNHIYSTRLADIKAGSRCPICQGKISPDISILQQFAYNKNGTLLTTTYTNCETKMLWECEKGHQWEATWSLIKRGCWCPDCKLYKYEQLTRNMLEVLLKKPFIKQKNFIPHNKYSGLELDGYNEELKLAFEYNGEQHYKKSVWFHKTQEDFEQQKERDLFKQHWCNENGIYLIVIPFFKNKVLESYLTQEIEKWQQSVGQCSPPH